MSYETAPATTMLASNCAICGRPLLDAVSVNAAIGPECRKKHGYTSEVTEENRAAANALIHEVALTTPSADSLPRLQVICRALDAMGMPRLAKVLIERNATVVIDVDGNDLLVFTPYNQELVADLHRFPAPGAIPHFDRESKAWRIPMVNGAKGALFFLLKRHFPGCLGVGPTGSFIIAGQRQLDTEMDAERAAS